MHFFALDIYICIYFFVWGGGGGRWVGELFMYKGRGSYIIHIGIKQGYKTRLKNCKSMEILKYARSYSSVVHSNEVLFLS